MFIPAGPHVLPGASSTRIKQQTSLSDDCADEHAGDVPSEEWNAIGHVLMPVVRACLFPDIETGWHNAGDACLQAEPICEALSLYHLLLSRDTEAYPQPDRFVKAYFLWLMCEIIPAH